ncbi:MAG: DUF4340 domain-containing protein [Myxococcales bacterium]
MKQTHKSLLTTLAFVVVAGAIAGAAFWVKTDVSKEETRKEKAAKVFDGLDKSKVRELRVSKEGKLFAAASRPDDKTSWKLTEPVQADADGTVIDAMVSAIADLKQKTEIGDGDAKQYGFDPPRIAATVKLDDGKEQSLEVGETNPFDNTIYVRKGGEKTIRVADGWAKSSFEKTLVDLRDKRVAHLDEGTEIRRIQVTGTKPPYTLEKEGTSWKLLAPQAGAADSGTADRIGSAVRGLRATGIATESADAKALKERGLSPAKIEVRLSVAPAGGKDAFQRTILIGQSAPSSGSVAVKTFAKRDDSPTIFEVDGQILKDLQKDPFDLQDKSLVHADREAVRKVVFEQPSAPKIVVERKKEQAPDAGFADETFTVLEPKQAPAKKWKLSSALYSITGLRAAAFDGKLDAEERASPATGVGRRPEHTVPESKLGPSRTITLLGDGDKVLARVRIGAETKDGKRRYVAVDGEDRIAEVEKVSVDDLPKTVDDVVEAPPVASGADGGTKLQASNPAK